MGDYYKIKKILLILIIFSTILRIINSSRVFASEAVEVTPTWNDGSFTYQADNQYLTLRQNQIDIQDSFITFLYDYLSNADDESLNRAKTSLRLLKNVLISTNFNSGYVWGGINTRLVWFSRVNSPVNGSNDYPYCFQILQAAALNNIVYADATLNSGYKILSVPFYSFTRNQTRQLLYFHGLNGSYYTVNSGDALVPVAEVGCYSTGWVDLFQAYGLINNSAEYETILADIENNQQLSLQQEQVQSAIQRDTNQVVTNSYNYIKDENVDQITSLGFSSPDVEEKIDLDDVFDQFETLLTDENYRPKQFSFWLPNGDETIFSLSPTLLEDNLTRVGGTYIIQIIHSIWFISLYGWYIFAYLGILGKLISGDWFHLVKGSAPVTRLVKMSVGSITGSGGF